MTLRQRFLVSTLVTIVSVVALMGWTLFELRQIQSYNEDYGKQLVEISELPDPAIISLGGHSAERKFNWCEV